MSLFYCWKLDTINQTNKKGLTMALNINGRSFADEDAIQQQNMKT